MGVLCRSIHLILVFSQAFIVPTFSLLYINDVSDDIACNIAIYADNTALH